MILQKLRADAEAYLGIGPQLLQDHRRDLRRQDVLAAGDLAMILQKRPADAQVRLGIRLELLQDHRR